MLMIYLRIHESENGVIIAMCDQGLIDSVIEDGEVVIDIKAYSGFYKGSLVEPSKVSFAGEKIYSVNAIGKESIELAVREGVIDESSVSVAGGIPYAHAYSFIPPSQGPGR